MWRVIGVANKAGFDRGESEEELRLTATSTTAVIECQHLSERIIGTDLHSIYHREGGKVQ